ncbi:3-phosphoshikimate 1-carboxyvinyltransferase [Weizmannia coagulans]|jgi:3-phosphoshikimate 1-carboxyvinyltransferase|uniref:3-phosphoshikimate 1-carboxyvinyltransferase n=3 Tax=Heyndrickxia TaxID=2837504 RepID=A0A0C5C7G5_HEYCO|nr:MULTISPECIES: 3-phosphoshikimate 1-carboxyvinyltransferase [Heyndrickxia]AEP02142.1 3-phosphoshikimate 1-carboxyvinyltransferase [Heyndrickxia coagulans 36D1]AJO22791.1 3-phosphoshikimate 1-carboxyvinyltransferase [Heyndrickxia coagulans]AKN55694.1 5-Enolpyruvylshikimate-3-phosphate synthase [Heyndrickxia coagulans]APB36291.1 3-phosphoshikimate 1-carboxyvinyltransferase [Heyndrickxia coagulans]ATW83042.1 3-phosphoshikimate 1-carboxyvinyltransferase [Heyndrickxia coagulans]
MEKLAPAQTGLKGTIKVPGDKSISHRSVMFAAVARGKTMVENFLPGADCLSTIHCFQQMSVPIERDGTRVVIAGKGWDGLAEPETVLDTGNSGTTTRLMLGLLAGRPFHSVIAGDESIAKRPMQRVTKPLCEMGAHIDGRMGGNFTPLSIRGGALQGIEYRLPVASAQVKSALLLAGLQADGTTIVHEPQPTRDHTERMIRAFGGEVRTEGRTISVRGGTVFHGTEIVVPGDISSAAFFMAAASLVPGSEIVLPDVGLNPTRAGIIDVLKQMGADMEVIETHAPSDGEQTGTLVIRPAALQGVEIGGGLIPRLIDEIPIIALLATQAEGRTVIKDAAELKVKETNRIDTVVRELKKLGAHIEATADGMIIEGPCRLSGGTVESHGDHRIGMMLAVASLVAKDAVCLKGAEAIAVSYPQFFDDLKSVL